MKQAEISDLSAGLESKIVKFGVIMKVIYKIIYPNDKIYIGKDLTDSIKLFWKCRQQCY